MMKLSRGRQIGAMVDFLVVVGLLWQQVFAMTGILDGQTSPAVERPTPPPAVQFREVPTDWIDLTAYLRTNPMWPIDRP